LDAPFTPIDKSFTVSKYVKQCPIVRFDEEEEEDEGEVDPPGNPVEPPS